LSVRSEREIQISSSSVSMIAMPYIPHVRI
jgi:hypothetical protein